MKYFSLDKIQGFSKQKRVFVLGERNAGRKVDCLKELERIGDENNQCMRFHTIEHHCKPLNLDPFKIAAILKQRGYFLIFDDDAISWEQNVQNENMVNKYLQTT